MNNTQQPYLIPFAIIIAGALVAGGIYFGGTKGSSFGIGNSDTADQTVQREIKVRDISSEDHILGNPNAKIKLIEYSDTECPFCKNFHITLHKVIDKYGKDGKVAWVYR
ncbi:MAG: DsbA family protein, partial [bacterium]|nr:DsbA family protein [bacterium]